MAKMKYCGNCKQWVTPTSGVSWIIAIILLILKESGGKKRTISAHTASFALSDEEYTPKEKTPGFEAAFAIAGLLAVAYLLKRRK